jgi:hypothetical protein
MEVAQNKMHEEFKYSIVIKEKKLTEKMKKT